MMAIVEKAQGLVTPRISAPHASKAHILMVGIACPACCPPEHRSPRCSGSPQQRGCRGSHPIPWGSQWVEPWPDSSARDRQPVLHLLENKGWIID